MAKPTSEHGFAYVFELPLEVFHELTNDYTGLQMKVVEEREDIQICHFYDYRTRLAQKATLVFELWTGTVYRTKKQDFYSVDVLIQGHDKLRHMDTAHVFGAMRFDVMNQIEHRRQQSERLLLVCMNLGYKLPPIPNSAMTTCGEETPNLARLLLEEITEYLERANNIRNRLQFAAPYETVKDLGRLLRRKNDRPEETP
jgi:hypothetical protein